jgi:hypothetical protein
MGQAVTILTFKPVSFAEGDRNGYLGQVSHFLATPIFNTLKLAASFPRCCQIYRSSEKILVPLRPACLYWLNCELARCEIYYGLRQGFSRGDQSQLSICDAVHPFKTFTVCYWLGEEILCPIHKIIIQS